MDKLEIKFWQFKLERAEFLATLPLLVMKQLKTMQKDTKKLLFFISLNKNNHCYFGIHFLQTLFFYYQLYEARNEYILEYDNTYWSIQSRI